MRTGSKNYISDGISVKNQVFFLNFAGNFHDFLPVEGNSSTERMEVEDDSMGVIDVNELSLDGNLREENSKNNQEHISVESTLSGINLLGPSEEFKRLQEEEQDALKAADEVQMAEETWIQELEGLMNICEKLKLLQQQSGSADIDRDGMNNDARQITEKLVVL